MKFHLREFALSISLWPAFALAQSNPPPVLAGQAASAPGFPASAVPDRHPPPKLQSPEVSGKESAAPGDLSPERPVSPQINIPFGKKSGQPTPREERLVQGGGSPASGVDDRAARCNSEANAQARASCRAKLPPPLMHPPSN